MAAGPGGAVETGVAAVPGVAVLPGGAWRVGSAGQQRVAASVPGTKLKQM